eukprot:TRINITY_DN2805_c0_g1_i1.p1 TRINITY_DN2805_c0_g1~~TRINITY_DN2805_c0_g1_i1.p1  ORF type:complete len:287 (-),score=81.20 TRINITY_DN2805_c0_g1_i1:69-929(-)
MAPSREEAQERLSLEHEFLDHAKAFEWDDVKTMLGEKSDLINVQPCGRWTALHQAAFNGNKEVAELLLEKGASVNATTRQGKLPFEVAKTAEVKKLLEKASERTEDAVNEKEGDAAPSPKKKARKEKAMPAYKLNINQAVDKEYEGSSLQELCDAPTSALKGIGPKGQEVLKKLKVKTIRQLGVWKFYRASKAIAGLAAFEQEDKREEGAMSNVNKAVDKAHETKTLNDIKALPPSALQGLAPWVDPELATMGVTTVEKLGEWKFAKMAEMIVELSEFENTDFGSS